MITLIILATIAWVLWGFVLSVLYFETFVFGGLNWFGWILFGPGFLLMKFIVRNISNNASTKLFNIVAKPFGD